MKGLDFFEFILNNSFLCILAFFGFFTFYKGLPFLIKHNEERHNKSQKKLLEIDSKLQNHMVEYKKDVEEIEKDVNKMQEFIKNIEEQQNEHKGIITAIESLILENWKNKNDK